MEFSLRKWYLDLVTVDGRFAIAYHAAVSIGGVHTCIAGLLVDGGDASPIRWRVRAGRMAAPELAGDELRWRVGGLGLGVELRGMDASHERRLLQTDAGSIDWWCVMPRARALLRTRDTTLEGLGYVERIEIEGILPWKIPADEIRWGRYLDETGSIVWIDWRGECPRRVVLDNGEPVSVSDLTDESIVFCNGDRLALTDSRAIDATTLGEILGPFEALRAATRPLRHVRQIRWCSVGEVRRTGTNRKGWALHERLARN